MAKQVEYDMDEQGSWVHSGLILFLTVCSDQEWLDQVNQERKKGQFNAVSYETFEIIIDKIEKEWFELVRYIPSLTTHVN